MSKRCWFSAFVLAGGCATAGPSRPLAEFPAPAELARIESQPVALPDLGAAPLPAEGWTVAAAAATSAPDETWTPTGPWGRHFQAAFASTGRKAQLTRAMACVAEQMGRFYLQNDSAGPDLLQQFVLAACGSLAPAAGYQLLTTEVPAEATDAQLIAHYAPQATRDLIAQVPAGATEIGSWAGRAKRRWIALATFATRQVDVQPFSLVPDASGIIRFEGRMHAEVSLYEAYINQGRHGVAACHFDPLVERPQFRVWCQLAPDDQAAWFQLLVAPPRSMLAVPVLQAMARRDPGQPITLLLASAPAVAAAPGAPAAGDDGVVAFRGRLVAALNAVRVEAGLAAVSVEAAQSDAAARLASQYFGAALGNRQQEASTIALGLMAGWQVAGAIRNGSFFSAVVPGAGGTDAWLQWALTLPMGRHTLLARDIDTLAVGSTSFRKARGAAVLVASYRLHHGDDHSADATLLFQRISDARQRAGLPPAQRMSGLRPTLAKEVARVQRGEQNARQALDASLEAAVYRQHRDMRGLLIESMSVEDLEIPKEILNQATVSLEIAIAHYKPPGAAWAQMVIVLVFASAGGVAT
ncbi:MAG TPA: hypothetical protein VMU50_02950 [Polyangia bacterium]|nr:hypothetical protein [Polyangia bacterium]